MTRPFDFSQAANTGISILPNLPPLPNVGDVLAVASLAGGRAQLAYTPISTGGTGPFLPLSGGTMTGMLVLPGTVPTLAGHATSKSYVDSLVAASRNAARLQAQWQNAATVSDDTIWLAYDAPYAGTINALTYFTGNGSFSVAVQINGVNVTGLSAVAVSSATPATATASAANTFTAGQRITAVITGTTGSPTDALLSLAVTWS